MTDDNKVMINGQKFYSDYSQRNLPEIFDEYKSSFEGLSENKSLYH